MNWYRTQQKVLGFTEIFADAELMRRIGDRSVNLTYAHNNLKQKLHHIGNDIALITDIDVSKKIYVDDIVKLVRRQYDLVNVGVYVSLLSYWITPRKTDKSLPESYADSIKIYFNKQFDFAKKIEDVSICNDDSMRINESGRLEEGSNFIFVHPNIRYWLWK